MTSSRSALGKQLRNGGATLGEVMAWLSALYFRGKLAYAARFGTSHPLPSGLVMTPGQGLRPTEWQLTADDLREMGKIDIETRAFITPLRPTVGRSGCTFALPRPTHCESAHSPTYYRHHSSYGAYNAGRGPAPPGMRGFRAETWRSLCRLSMNRV